MMNDCQVNSSSSQKGEEKIKEKSRQMTDAITRRETTLLTELRRVTTERQCAIDAELDRIRYNIKRSVKAKIHYTSFHA